MPKQVAPVFRADGRVDSRQRAVFAIPERRHRIKAGESHLGKWLSTGMTDDEVVELVYLSTRSRRPTIAERELVRKYLVTTRDRAAGFYDLQHALLISNESLLRHSMSSNSCESGIGVPGFAQPRGG